MPRPRKCRKVCCLPKCKEFVPVGVKNKKQIILTVDEFESIRLIDKIGLSQEECASYMEIARTTAQQVYQSAKNKIAIALVDGLSIKIEGGDYKLCEGDENYCMECLGCRKKIEMSINNKKNLKENGMRVLIPVDDEKNVCVSFARAPQFAIKEVGKDEITYIDNSASEAESGAGLKASQVVIDNNANVILTVRLGENSAEVLKSANIEIYKTQGNNVLENFKLFEENKLEKLTKFHQGYHGIQ